MGAKATTVAEVAQPRGRSGLAAIRPLQFVPVDYELRTMREKWRCGRRCIFRVQMDPEGGTSRVGSSHGPRLKMARRASISSSVPPNAMGGKAGVGLLLHAASRLG
jgi:hypothetical protein